MSKEDADRLRAKFQKPVPLQKNSLTKEEIFEILDTEIEKIEAAPPKIWGFVREDILEILEGLKEKVEER